MAARVPSDGRYIGGAAACLKRGRRKASRLILFFIRLSA